MRRFSIISVMLGILMVSCAAPRELGESVTELQHAEIIKGSPFQHRVLLRQLDHENFTLNIYIEGDGLPWLAKDRIADNPSPERSLVLAMMKADAHAAFVGRPCYFVDNDPNCHPGLWTNARYSDAVVESMASVIEQVRRRSGATRLVLIGYSGGGTLATLLAPRLPAVDAVITLAANLDIEAWAQAHAFSPLDQSLNPAQLPPLQGVWQKHLVGARDSNTSAAINRRFFIAQGVEPELVADFNHHCCWLTLWQARREALLAALKQEINN